MIIYEWTNDQMEGFVRDGLAKSIGVSNFTRVSDLVEGWCRKEYE